MPSFKRVLLTAVSSLVLWFGFTVAVQQPAEAVNYSSTHYVCYHAALDDSSLSFQCTYVYNSTQALDALHNYEDVVASRSWTDELLTFTNPTNSIDSTLIVLFYRVIPCASGGGPFTTPTSFHMGAVDAQIRDYLGITSSTWGMGHGISSLHNTSDWAHGSHCRVIIYPINDTNTLDGKNVPRCNIWNTLPDFYNYTVGKSATYENNVGLVDSAWSSNVDCTTYTF